MIFSTELKRVEAGKERLRRSCLSVHTELVGIDDRFIRLHSSRRYWRWNRCCGTGARSKALPRSSSIYAFNLSAAYGRLHSR